MYIAVRADLHPGLAAAQAVHAAFAFTHDHPDLVEPWLPDPFLILVTVPDEATLLDLALTALGHNVAAALWREPDLDNQATAIALQPGSQARRLCANLPLLGRVPAVSTG